jgi:hypothetical protein
MAVSGKLPFVFVEDSNGDPIVGAILKVYEIGTTSYRAIYSDSGLTTPMTNPIAGANASDASGKFPVFYMAAGTYKLRAETSTGTLIWEYDNLDTGTSAGAGALPIASGGTGATTAAAARANLDVPSNSELTALSATIATFTASLQNIVSQPQGRLTPTSLTPVITTGVTAGTAVYYTPYTGNLCPVYDGTQFNLKIFAELTLTLTASYVLNSHYDCFIINDSGTVRIVTGPAWSTITAGSGARGTGAGTTELTRLNGLLVNANAMATARNGATTYSVAANQGTFVGSIYIDGTAGQITCHTAYGQSRKWAISNAYNRMPVFLKAGDATATWSYLTNTVRAARADATNCLDVFQCLAEEEVDLQTTAYVGGSTTTNQLMKGQIGIGYNSTTTFSGKTGIANFTNSTASPVSFNAAIQARYLTQPALGYNRITALESGLGADVATWNGTETYMLLSAVWRA